MKVKQLKEIIMNLDENFKVEMEDQDDRSATLSISGVEICLQTNTLIIKNY